MAVRGTYCPYEILTLASVVAGTDREVPTSFGRLHCFSTDALSTGAPGIGRGTLFVHGVHDDMNAWSALVQAATEHGVDLGPALFVDLPGFGTSENRHDRLDLSEVADELIRVARTTSEFTRLRVVGHSMGTLVAAEMAVRHPETVESLHLAAGPYYSIIDVMNGRMTGGSSGLLATATFASQYLLALTGRGGVGGVRLARRLGALRALLWPFAAHPFSLRASVLDQLIASLRPHSFRRATRNGFRFRHGMVWSPIRCPVAAVYGAKDRLVPGVDARRLGTDLPLARITTLPEAAHLLHLEQPYAVLVALGLA